MPQLSSLQTKIYLLTGLLGSLNILAKTPLKTTPKAIVHQVSTTSELINYKPAIVKFYSTHCGACKMIARTYEELATTHPEINFVEVDGTKADALMKKYQIKAFPTFIFLKDPSQKPTQTLIGADKEKLVQAIKEFTDLIKQPTKKITSSTVREISSLKELEEAIAKAPKLVIAEYHAEAWCPACKMFAQPFVDLSGKFEELVFIKMDDMKAGNKEIAKKHKITALPTTLIFAAGQTDQPIEIVIGGNPAKLEAAIQKHLDQPAKAAKPTEQKGAKKTVPAKLADNKAAAATSVNHSPAGTVQVITSKEQFDNLLKSAHTPIVVEYHAEAWCGACKVYKPIFEKMATEYPKFKFVKIDHDTKANQPIAATYGIGAFPTTLIFQAGKLVKSIVGINVPEIETALKAL